VPVPSAPHLRRYERVHARHEDVLIVRPVEDDDFAGSRNLPVYPPQEVVGGFELSRFAECSHPRAARIEPAKHMTDRPVLAGRVHGLEHDEK
jgi:hypothetical protein